MATDKSPILSDRFIPVRKASQTSLLSYSSTKQRTQPSTKASNYQRMICTPQQRHLHFSKPSPISHSKSLDSLMKLNHPFDVKTIKKEQSICENLMFDEIIDASGVENNFYNNVLDWSSQEIISVATESVCYLKNARHSKVFHITREHMSLHNESISSTKFNPSGNLLAIGNNIGKIRILDVASQRDIRKLKYHTNRVGCLQFISDSLMLSGSKDGSIKFHDLRIRESHYNTFSKHNQQITGIAYQNSEVASGSNGNEVLIWDIRNLKQINRQKYHRGAVKAISWCPWKSHTLATGGGSKDQMIVIWNSESKELESTFTVGAQVTCLNWNPLSNNLVFSAGNNGYVWSCQKNKIITKLKGFRKRILALKVNPVNNCEVTSIGAQEVMMNWVLPYKKTPIKEEDGKLKSSLVTIK